MSQINNAISVSLKTYSLVLDIVKIQRIFTDKLHLPVIDEQMPTSKLNDSDIVVYIDMFVSRTKGNVAIMIPMSMRLTSELRAYVKNKNITLLYKHDNEIKVMDPDLGIVSIDALRQELIESFTNHDNLTMSSVYVDLLSRLTETKVLDLGDHQAYLLPHDVWKVVLALNVKIKGGYLQKHLTQDTRFGYVELYLKYFNFAKRMVELNGITGKEIDEIVLSELRRAQHVGANVNMNVDEFFERHNVLHKSK